MLDSWLMVREGLVRSDSNVVTLDNDHLAVPNRYIVNLVGLLQSQCLQQHDDDQTSWLLLITVYPLTSKKSRVDRARACDLIT